MKAAVLFVLFFGLLVVNVAVAPSERLLHPRPKPVAKMTLGELERWQISARAHYRGACRTHHKVASRRTLASREVGRKRFYCSAVEWTARELRETRTRIRQARMRAQQIDQVWIALASCESGGRWDYNGGSGFDGGLQFHPGTWAAYRPVGYPVFAYLASPWQQVRVAKRVLASQGWGAWPACSRALGLR